MGQYIEIIAIGDTDIVGRLSLSYRIGDISVKCRSLVDNFCIFSLYLEQLRLVCGNAISTNISLIIFIVFIIHFCEGFLVFCNWNWNDKIAGKINVKRNVRIEASVSLVFQKSTENEHRDADLKYRRYYRYCWYFKLKILIWYRFYKNIYIDHH